MAAALVSSGFPGAGAWEQLAPYAVPIAELDRADLIVVSGEREVGDAAGVLELRVRQALRRGARLLLAGSGGGDLDLVAAGRIEASEISSALSAAAHPVLIATDPAAVATAAAVAHAAGLGDGPGGVIALPEGPNERGLHALGYRDDVADVLRRAEDGTLQMLVVLGDADPISCFPEPGRWEAAVQRCESVVASSLFPTPTALWAHVILPATSALEKEGTVTNLEGRTQRLRRCCRRPQASLPSCRCSPRQAATSISSSRRALPAPSCGSPSHPRCSRGSPGRPSARARRWAFNAHGPRRLPPRHTCRRRRRAATGYAQSGGARCSPAPRSRVPSGSRSSAPTRSWSPARMRCVWASRKARASRSTTPAGRPTGTARLSRTLAAGAVRFDWDGAPVDGACTIEEQA